MGTLTSAASGARVLGPLAIAPAFKYSHGVFVFLPIAAGLTITVIVPMLWFYRHLAPVTSSSRDVADARRPLLDPLSADGDDAGGDQHTPSQSVPTPAVGWSRGESGSDAGISDLSPSDAAAMNGVASFGGQPPVNSMAERSAPVQERFLRQSTPYRVAVGLRDASGPSSVITVPALLGSGPVGIPYDRQVRTRSLYGATDRDMSSRVTAQLLAAGVGSPDSAFVAPMPGDGGHMMQPIASFSVPADR